MISVCIPAKNKGVFYHDGRTAFPLSKCVRSIASSLSVLELPHEIIIADAGNAGFCVENLPPTCRSVSMPEAEWTRGGARNFAAVEASGDILAFIDADMLVGPTFFLRGLQETGAGNGYFPWYMRQRSFASIETAQPPQEGIGHGCCVVRREHWEANHWPETAGWGGEDTAFAQWFDKQNLMIRDNWAGLIHLWHPAAEKK